MPLYVFYVGHHQITEFKIDFPPSSNTTSMNSTTHHPIYNKHTHPHIHHGNNMTLKNHTFNTSPKNTSHSEMPSEGMTGAKCIVRVKSVKKQQNRVLVVGGMSHIGMALALRLHKLKETNYKVTVLEDLLNIETDPLKWDRWSELFENKLDLSIIKFQEEGTLRLAIQKAYPSVVVYIPTLFLHPVTTGPGRLIHRPIYGSVVVQEFLRVIEMVRKNHHQSRFILVSGYTNSLIHQQWLHSLESIFSAYQSLHKDFLSTLVQLPKGVFGPGQDFLHDASLENKHWYIDDVISVLQQLIDNTGNCTVYSFDNTSMIPHTSRTQLSVAKYQTQQWMNNYTVKSFQAKNVTFGAYFVQLSTNYYHRRVIGDLFSYMHKWTVSGYKVGLENILFHDTLSSGFTKRIHEKFNNTVFVKVKSRNRKSPNDQRFYFIYDYLLSHRDIGMVVASDIKDIWFLYDPAAIMKGLGDYFYIGIDIAYILYTDWLQRGDFIKCFKRGGDWKIEESMKLFGFLNVGAIGGTRASMLTSLAYFVHCLDRSTDRCCCDMSASQYIYHAVFFDQLYIGYPFNMAFKSGQPGPFGMAVKHKDNFDEI